MSKRRRCCIVGTVVNVLKEQGVLTIDIQEAFRRDSVDALMFSNKDAEFREGDLIYEPVLTVKAGEMVWRSVTF